MSKQVSYTIEVPYDAMPPLEAGKAIRLIAIQAVCWMCRHNIPDVRQTDAGQWVHHVPDRPGPAVCPASEIRALDVDRELRRWAAIQERKP